MSREQVKQGVQVTKYIETESNASVEVNGETYTADVVVGADGSSLSPSFAPPLTRLRIGVKSKARELVLGYADAPKPSGYAIFRTSYSADLIRANPVCAHLAKEGVDARTVWIGPDLHFIHGSSEGGKKIHWLLTQ